MLLPPNTASLLAIINPMIVGAVFMAIVFRQIKRPMILGGALGAVAGMIGGMFFMVPLGYCTFEPDRDPIDHYFGIFLVALSTFGVLFGTKAAVEYFVGQGRPLNVASAGYFKGWLMPWLLLAPSLIILALFLYYPALDTFRLSTLLARLGNSRTVFVCVDNFTRLLNEDGFNLVTLFMVVAFVGAVAFGSWLHKKDELWRKMAQYALWFGAAILLLNGILPRLLSNDYYGVVTATVGISLAIVVFSLFIALGIAYMAYQPIRGANIYRTLLIWPYAISPPVAGIIFFIIFNPSAGIVNHMIESLGGEGLPWLQNASIAPWTIIIASVWKSLGFSILFYIAGLQNVPKDLVEAAAIDGANAWRRFWTIVFPLLSPITFFLIITNITYAFFDIFGTIDFLTRGGPAGATSVMIYEIYEVGINNNDLGKSAAQSLVLFALVIGITYLQFRTTGRRVNYGG